MQDIQVPTISNLQQMAMQRKSLPRGNQEFTI